MADTDRIRPYRQAGFPQIRADDLATMRRYILEELKRIEQMSKTVQETLILHEARLTGGGL